MTRIETPKKNGFADQRDIAAVLNNTKPPPADPETEVRLLGSMWHYQDEIADKAIAALNRTDFSSHQHASLFKTLSRLHHDGKPFNEIAVREHFGGEDSTAIIDVIDTIARDVHPLAANHADYYIKRLSELGQRRRLIYSCIQTASAAYDETFPVEEMHLDFSDEVCAVDGGKFKIVTGAELAAADCQIEYIIDGWLVKNQPCVMAGAKKTLKTNLSIELAISIATRSKFLDTIYVDEALPVLVLSGESGKATIQETYSRIVRSKGWGTDQIHNLHFCFTVPTITDTRDIAEIKKIIIDRRIGVVIIDPAYLSMDIADKAGNLFAVGKQLQSLTHLAEQTGVTPILVHHTTQASLKYGEPPQLEDIAWSGFQEWARQWILLGRRKQYDHDQPGYHELWVTAGGSAGHSQGWGLNVREGAQDDPGGRCWDLDVVSAGAARHEAVSEAEQQKQDEADQKAQTRLTADCERVEKYLKRHPDGETKTAIRDGSGINMPRISAAICDMQEREIIEPCGVQKPNRKTPHDGFKLSNINHPYHQDQPPVPVNPTGDHQE